MSMATSQATSGVDYGDNSKGLSGWVVAVIVAAIVLGIVLWKKSK